MTNLGIGFKVFSGDLLEKILAKSTDTKIKSILFGTLSTLIIVGGKIKCNHRKIK